MARKSNIEKYNESLTQEQRIENASKAGIASGISRNQNKKFQDIYAAIMEMPMKSGKLKDIEDIKNFASLKGANLTTKEAIAIKTVQDYFETGNPKLLEFIRDTSGEKPDNKVNLDMNLPVMFVGEDELDE